MMTADIIMKNALSKSQVLSLIKGVKGLHELDAFIQTFRFDAKPFFLNGPFEELLLSGQDVLVDILKDGRDADWEEFVDILEDISESAEEKYDKYYSCHLKEDGNFHLSEYALRALSVQASQARHFHLFLERITGKRGNPFAPEDPFFHIFNCIRVHDDLL